jgi:hypothetical protein
MNLSNASLRATFAFSCLLITLHASCAQQPNSVAAPLPVAQVNRIAVHPDLQAKVSLPGHRPRWVTAANLSTQA